MRGQGWCNMCSPLHGLKINIGTGLIRVEDIGIVYGGNFSGRGETTVLLLPGHDVENIARHFLEQVFTLMMVALTLYASPVNGMLN